MHTYSLRIVLAVSRSAYASGRRGPHRNVGLRCANPTYGRVRSLKYSRAFRSVIQRNKTICTARDLSVCPVVIPAKAGIHAPYWRWIPAFAGMTVRPFIAVCQHVARGFCRKENREKRGTPQMQSGKYLVSRTARECGFPPSIRITALCDSPATACSTLPCSAHFPG